MAWVIAVQKAGSGLVRLVRKGETIAHDDRRCGDVHIAPCAEIGNRFDFGAQSSSGPATVVLKSELRTANARW